MSPNIEITRNDGASRYEIFVDDQLAGYATYEEHGNAIAIPHTFVDPARRGGHLARRLVTFALEDIRSQGRSVLPACPYVAWLIDQEPEAFRDLVTRDEGPGLGPR